MAGGTQQAAPVTETVSTPVVVQIAASNHHRVVEVVVRCSSQGHPSHQGHTVHITTGGTSNHVAAPETMIVEIIEHIVDAPDTEGNSTRVFQSNSGQGYQVDAAGDFEANPSSAPNPNRMAE